ncbi:MAG: hypothetical protein M3328_13815, partial [Chloroflexota bacterium]|nr:hypothetical protein [Chloroflexota bacterium]
LLSGAAEPVVDLLTRLGREIGGFAQLSNDLEAVLPLDISVAEVALIEEGDAPRLKTDLRLRKRTLPVVFTLREGGDTPNPLQRAFTDPTYATSVDEDALRRAILEAGGVQFAQLVMEVHAQNIVQLLGELEPLRPGASEMLAYLLPVRIEQGSGGEEC